MVPQGGASAWGRCWLRGRGRQPGQGKYWGRPQKARGPGGVAVIWDMTLSGSVGRKGGVRGMNTATRVVPALPWPGGEGHHSSHWDRISI